MPDQRGERLQPERHAIFCEIGQGDLAQDAVDDLVDATDRTFEAAPIDMVARGRWMIRR